MQPCKNVAGEREKRWVQERNFNAFNLIATTPTPTQPKNLKHGVIELGDNRQAMAPLQVAAGNLTQHSAALDTRPRKSAHGNAGDALHDGEDGHGEWIQQPLFHRCDPVPRVLVSG